MCFSVLESSMTPRWRRLTSTSMPRALKDDAKSTALSPDTAKSTRSAWRASQLMTPLPWPGPGEQCLWNRQSRRTKPVSGDRACEPKRLDRPERQRLDCLRGSQSDEEVPSIIHHIYFSWKPKASTSHRSSMRLACMEVSTIQVFWSCFQLANSGLRISEISTYPALMLIAQQFKFSCRCHSFKPTKKHTPPHKTRKLTSTCFFYGKMASSKPLRTCLANTSLKLLLKLTTSCATMRPDA